MTLQRLDDLTDRCLALALELRRRRVSLVVEPDQGRILFWPYARTDAALRRRIQRHAPELAEYILSNAAAGHRG